MKIKKCNNCNAELPYDLIGHAIFSYNYYTVQFHPQINHKHEISLDNEDNTTKYYCSEKCIREDIS